jgi:hypothetical protein
VIAISYGFPFIMRPHPSGSAIIIMHHVSSCHASIIISASRLTCHASIIISATHFFVLCLHHYYYVAIFYATYQQYESILHIGCMSLIGTNPSRDIFALSPINQPQGCSTSPIAIIAILPLIFQ